MGIGPYLQQVNTCYPFQWCMPCLHQCLSITHYRWGIIINLLTVNWKQKFTVIVTIRAIDNGRSRPNYATAALVLSFLYDVIHSGGGGGGVAGAFY